MSASSPGVPSTGSAFSLFAFEAAIQRDDEILGVLYTGSLGRGMADRYSDLDIEAWVTDDALQRVDKKLEEILGLLGTVQFVYRRGPAFVTGFVGPDWQRVDLQLHDPSDARPHAEYARERVVKDVTGLLTQLVDSAPSTLTSVTWEEAKGAIEESIDSLMYLTLHNARGACWSAAGELTYRLAILYSLLARLRGQESYGFRYVEEILSTQERELLHRAWPVNVDQDAVRRAALGLWAWTRHVWREVERVLDRRLEIELDEVGMLAAIDRYYI